MHEAKDMMTVLMSDCGMDGEAVSVLSQTREEKRTRSARLKGLERPAALYEGMHMYDKRQGSAICTGRVALHQGVWRVGGGCSEGGKRQWIP